MTEEAFGHSLSTYLVVIAVAATAGLVRLLNSTEGWKWSHLFRDCITSAFNGVVVFWFCDYKKITGSLQLVVVAVAAMMGTRVWVEVENYLRMRYGSGRVASNSNTNSPIEEQVKDDLATPAQEETK